MDPKKKKMRLIEIIKEVEDEEESINEKVKEEKQKTDEELEEENNETEEREQETNDFKISPKYKEMMELEQEKINNERSNCEFDFALDNDDDDDDDDDYRNDMELKYDSDGSVINDNIISYSSKYKLSPEEKRTLDNLFIRLKHEVSPQHKVEKTAGTRVLNKKEKEEFEKYAVLRTGKYLERENKTLRRNWRNFCIEYKWNVNNPRPFLQMRHKNKVSYIDFKERMKFIKFLANGLNNRSLYSVFNRFKILFDPHKVSRYSKNEDNIIMEFIQRYKISDRERDRKFAELALILRRTRASVWRRYRVLKKKYNLQNAIK